MIVEQPRGSAAPTLRTAAPVDAPSVGRLHADSWRRHYGFAYPPEFFGESLDDDRASTWAARLSSNTPATHTTVAEVDGEVIGFVHVVIDDDDRWGSLVDNLHVRHDMQGTGIGRALLHAAASAAGTTGRTTGIYLWVLERNESARSFYSAVGGQEVESLPALSPALPGTNKIRCTWSTAAELRQATAALKPG